MYAVKNQQPDEVLTNLLNAFMGFSIDELTDGSIYRQIINECEGKYEESISQSVKSIIELAIDTAILMKM